MTIVDENVKAEFLPTLKALFKTMDAKVKVKKSGKDIVREWGREAQEALEAYKSGKIKAYTDIKQMHKDILNNE